MDEPEVKKKLKAFTNLAHVVEIVRGIVGLQEEGKHIQQGYSRDFFEKIGHNTKCSDDVALAASFAVLNPLYLTDILEANKGILEFAEGVLADKVVEIEWIKSHEDIELITNFIKFIKNLRPRSKQQLIQFMNSVKYDEDGYLVIQISNNGGAEARFRYNCPNEILEWFKYDKP